MSDDHWTRLEVAVDAAVRQCEGWRLRALEAEAEARRLQEALEEIADFRAGDSTSATGDAEGIRAENAALRARLGEARRILTTIQRRVDAISTANE